MRLNCAVLSLGMTIFMGVPSPQSLLANETHEVSVETPLEITSGQFDRQVLQEIYDELKIIIQYTLTNKTLITKGLSHKTI